MAYQQNWSGPVSSPFVPGLYVVTSPTASVKVPVLSHPTTNVKIIAQLSDGASVQALEQQGSWLRIQLPQGQTGYISATSAQPQQKPRASLILPPYGGPPAAPASQSQSTNTPMIEYSSKPKGRGAKMLGVALIVGLSSAALFFGFILSSIVEENCSLNILFGGTVQEGCQVVSHPDAAPGSILLILGALGMLLAIILAVKMRSKRQ